jgi:hypothetical protein
MENNNSHLTAEDKKLMQSVKKVSDKFRGLIFAGMFTILAGVIVGVGNLLGQKDDSYFIVSIFFITNGIIVVRDSFRHKKIYLLLKKLTGKDYKD